MENFSTGVMAKFELDYATVAAENPRLIYASVSAYGRDGALMDRLGFDPIAQAESGFMSMNGEPDRVGLRAGPSIMDMSTAMMTCNAVLAALFARERLGRGQFIESALFDTAVTMVGFHAMNYLASGDEPTRFGNNSRDTVPTAAMETSDAPIFIACANDRTWQRMAVRVLERPDLTEHPDYANTRERTDNRDALLGIVGDILRTKPRAAWLSQNARSRRAGRRDQFDRGSVRLGRDESARPRARDPASGGRNGAEHSAAVPHARDASGRSGGGSRPQSERARDFA